MSWTNKDQEVIMELSTHFIDISVLSDTLSLILFNVIIDEVI